MNSMHQITLGESTTCSLHHPIGLDDLECTASLWAEKRWITTGFSFTNFCTSRIGFASICPFHRTVFGTLYLLRYLTVSRRSFTDGFPTLPTSPYGIPLPLSCFVWVASLRRKLPEIDFEKFMNLLSSFVSFHFPYFFYWFEINQLSFTCFTCFT